MKKFYSAKLVILTLLLCALFMSILCACNVNKTSSGEDGKYHVHLYGAWQTAIYPTCMAEGEYERFCSCGERQAVTISPTGHDYIVHEEQQATCVEVGWTEYKTCSRCDYTDYSEISPLGHEFGEWRLNFAATCSKPGEEIRICSRGIHTETRELPLVEHTASEWLVITKATCDTDGEKIKRCAVCNCELEKEIIAALGHKWENGVCVVCGADYSD